MMVMQIYDMVICCLLTKLTNFAFLSLAVFAHFDTFPDGWVVGEKIKNKDQLSLAKA